ncbi:MAG: glycosyltransferase family 4 protein [Hyphomonadaceae bacterium]|nr:glycosyltransferase family 4 protein [Hyphomonadaceae bacterium]
MVERVVFPFRGAELGGSHVATFTLAQAIQSQSQVECVVLCPPDTLIMKEADRLGIRTVSSQEAPTGRNNAVTDFTGIARRRRILDKEKVGSSCVVHCNDVNSLRAWGLPARLSGMGVVYHHHALNRMWWPPHLVSLGFANAIVCVSDSTMEAMRGWRRDATKALNPFDIDTSIDRQTTRQQLLDEFGWPADAKIVGWIGNFWARKRPAFFLEVAAALVKRDARCRFVMFGRSGDFSVEDIETKAVELGVAGVTAIPGFRQPVEANLAGLDLLLAPAPREPFGRALVEAIILGTPIVATRGAGHSEIIGNWGGGVLANEEDTAEEVANLCATVLTTPERYRLKPQRATEIAAELAPEAYADRMLSLYAQIAGPRRNRDAARALALRPGAPLPERAGSDT